MNKIIKIAMCIGLWAAAGSVAAQQAATQARAVDVSIAAQPMNDALNRLASQTGVRVVFFPQAVQGMTAPPLKGTFTPDEAFKRLLSESKLTWRFMDARTVEVRAPGQMQTDATTGMVELPAAGNLQVAAADTQNADRGADPNKGAQGNDDSAGNAQEIVVTATGTRLRGVSPASPVIVLGQEDIKNSGATNTTDLLRLLPQNFGGGQSPYNNAATGNATENTNVGQISAVNLRGLGAESTLTLLNGNRLAPSGTAGSVDISAIPLSAIERVEILTDGASAIYGADAIGGVVNFILKSDLRGAQTGVQYGESSRGDGVIRQVSQSLGHGWSSGNALLSYEYNDQGEILSRDRHYAAPVPLPVDLLGTSERHNVLLSVEQSLSSTFSVFARALWAERQSQQDVSGYSTAAIAGNISDAKAKQHSVTAGLSARDLIGDWRANLLVSLAKDTVNAVSYQTAAATGAVTAVGGSRYDNKVNEVELNFDGILATLPGGALRAGFGFGAREDKPVLARLPSLATRRVKDVFAEVQVPLIGAGNRMSLVESLALSLEGRHEHYSDFGDAFSPKFGLVYVPVEGVRLRGTFGKAFRAPNFQQQYSANTAILLTVPANTIPGSPSFVELAWLGGNPALQAERSKSWTAGLDFTPAAVPGLNVSLTYFDIDYTNRIQGTASNFFAVFSDPLWTPYIRLNPTLAEVQAIVSSASSVINQAGGAPLSSVTAIVDSRSKNVAVLENNGVDLDVRWNRPLGAGRLGLSFNAQKTLANDIRAFADSPPSSRLDVIYRPVSLRARGGGNYSLGRWSAALFANYTHDKLNDTVTPNEHIASWTTLDSQVAYSSGETGSRWLDGIRVALSVSNLLDRDPPYIRSSTTRAIGYDTTTSDPRGRFYTVSFEKRW